MKRLAITTLMFVLSGLFVPAHAGSLDADSVPAGFDYLRTLPGTFFNIGGSAVPLRGADHIGDIYVL